MNHLKLLSIATALGFAFLSGPLQAAGQTETGKAGPAKIEKLYVFGDSYSDQGEGYLDADGPTAVVYFAQKLGIRMSPSNTEDIKYRSLNYAISGAQTGSGKGNMIQGKLIG